MSALISGPMTARPHLLSLVEDPPTLTNAGNTQIVLAALLGIAAVVVLIVWAKMHPFLALMLGTAVMGIVAGVAPLDIITSFTTGFGGTVGAVGLLIGLGAMLGALLADSGGADTIVDTIIGKVGARGLPWAMALIAAILGLPLFFEVGVVLLVPVVILVARRTDVPLMRVGIPALAGLSILHGLVPPHPGPLVAIDALGADLGLTLLFGLIVAVPTLVLCGPLLARLVEQWVPLHASDEAVARVTGGHLGAAAGAPARNAARPGGRDRCGRSGGAHTRWRRGGITEAQAGTGGDPDRSPAPDRGRRRPSFAFAVVVDHPAGDPDARPGHRRADHEGRHPAAHLPGVHRHTRGRAAAGRPALHVPPRLQHRHEPRGRGEGDGVRPAGHRGHPAHRRGRRRLQADARRRRRRRRDRRLGPGLGDLDVAARLAGRRRRPPRDRLGHRGHHHRRRHRQRDRDRPAANEVSLLVLAIGCGSLFFSHVNDAGFWLVKEYFGLTVGQTIKSWSVMETAISVVGIICVLLLNLVV